MTLRSTTSTTEGRQEEQRGHEEPSSSPPPPPKQQQQQQHVNILIIGGGPTGLGAAARIHELQRRASTTTSTSTTTSSTSTPTIVTNPALPQLPSLTHLLVDENPGPGGLASTHRTKENFLFDLGGHVIFSHYAYFDDLLRYAVGTTPTTRANRTHHDAVNTDDTDNDNENDNGGTAEQDAAWCVHKRESYVYLDHTYIPYPFQLNFGRLPSTESKAACLHGLIDVELQRRSQKPPPPTHPTTNATTTLTDTTTTDDDTNEPSCSRPPRTFDQWILASMGEGIADIFMRPYNFKVWAYPTTVLAAGWLGERVATVDLHRAVRSAVGGASGGDREEGDKGWGPNATFAFPAKGGTGSIWTAVAEKALSPNTQLYSTTITSINIPSKTATLHSPTSPHPQTITYDYLISTAPLDLLLPSTPLPHLASRLRYSSTHVVGLGVRGPLPPKLEKRCWVYYPGDDVPFYRCTVFSNYAEGNCPGEDVVLGTLGTAGCWGDVDGDVDGDVGGDGKGKGPYYSLMFETSESVEYKPMAHYHRTATPSTTSTSYDPRTIIADTVRGALLARLLLPASEIVSVFHRRLERGYPTPHVDRDSVLDEVLPYLKERGVYSRGRFGSWKYEVSNQDHSLMLGVEAVDNILFNSPEVTLETPNVINGNRGAKRLDRRFFTGTAASNSHNGAQ